MERKKEENEADQTKLEKHDKAECSSFTHSENEITPWGTLNILDGLFM